MAPLLPAPAHAEADYLHTILAQAQSRGLARSRTWQVLLHYHPSLLGKGPSKGPLDPPRPSAVGQSPPALTRSGKGPSKGPLDPPRPSAVGQSPPALTRVLAGWSSSADGDGFFLSGRRGAHDPEAELGATLAAFAAPASQAALLDEAGQHPQCRFPARWAWLKHELAIDTNRLPEQPCPLFATWRQGIAPEKVAIIYSSAYINSPASMYGHTFLRLSRKTGEGQKLIDYIVNFAADSTTTNGIVYALRGLFGGFEGRFYVMPYYVKIQEYSNIESRDLWEYELALSPDEAERLVEHTWETRSTHFNYYFVTENCSYFLLELLEAARPDLHLSETFHGAVIPTETLRAVLRVQGLVRSRAVRPSLRVQLLAHKSSLSRAEARVAEALVEQSQHASDSIAGWPKEKQARTLDAAYALLRFREGIKKDPSPLFLSKERQLLILRGRTGVPPIDARVQPASDAPETGHRSLRLGVSGGIAGSNGSVGSPVASFEELSLRLALHDFLDPSRGYLDDAELEMMQLRLRFYNRSHELFPERLDLLGILSVSGFDRWIPKTAWTVRAFGAQAHDLGCTGLGCSYAALQTGGGLALRAGHPFLFYLLTSVDLGAGEPFDSSYRIGLGGLAGCVLRLGNISQVKAEGHYIYYFLGDTRRAPVLDFGWALNIGRWAELRLVGQAIGSYTEGRTELHGYF